VRLEFPPDRLAIDDHDVIAVFRRDQSRRGIFLAEANRILDRALGIRFVVRDDRVPGVFFQVVRQFQLLVVLAVGFRKAVAILPDDIGAQAEIDQLSEEKAAVIEYRRDQEKRQIPDQRVARGGDIDATGGMADDRAQALLTLPDLV